jgi:uncharacterized protein YkwD
MSSRKNLAALVGALLLAVVPVATVHADSQFDPLIVRALELTNAERQRNGLAPLAFSPELGQAAQAYSAAMASSECFAHTCGPISKMSDRIDNAGYIGWTSLAENIGMGYQTPDDVIAGWMDSDGHRSNMLSPRFTEIGIGVAKGGAQSSLYWTQNFGTRGTTLAPMISVPTHDADPESKSIELEVASEGE